MVRFEPLIDTLPNHNEDRELEKIIGVQPDQKTVPTKGIAQTKEWKFIQPMMR